MGIGERLKQSSNGKNGNLQSILKHAGANGNGSGSESSDATVDATRHHDPIAALRVKTSEALFERLGQRLFDPNLSEQQLQSHVVQELDTLLGSELTQLSTEERHELVQSIAADILGLGPIEQYMADPEVTEVMINSVDSIYIERAGRLYLTDSRFVAVEHLRRVIERIVSAVGRRIDESSPWLTPASPMGPA